MGHHDLRNDYTEYLSLGYISEESLVPVLVNVKDIETLLKTVLVVNSDLFKCSEPISIVVHHAEMLDKEESPGFGTEDCKINIVGMFSDLQDDFVFVLQPESLKHLSSKKFGF